MTRCSRLPRARAAVSAVHALRTLSCRCAGEWGSRLRNATARVNGNQLTIKHSLPAAKNTQVLMYVVGLVMVGNPKGVPLSTNMADLRLPTNLSLPAANLSLSAAASDGTAPPPNYSQLSPAVVYEPVAPTTAHPSSSTRKVVGVRPTNSGRAGRGETKSATAAGSRGQVVLSRVGLILLLGGVVCVVGWLMHDDAAWSSLADEAARSDLVTKLSHEDPGLNPCTYHLHDNKSWVDKEVEQASALSMFEPVAHCSSAFLLISAPIIAGCSSIFVGAGVMIAAHGHFLRKRPRSCQAITAKLLPWLVLCVLVGVWATSSIMYEAPAVPICICRTFCVLAGHSHSPGTARPHRYESLRAASLVKSLSTALFLMGILLMAATVGPSSLATSFRNTTAVTTIERWLDSDWARSIAAMFLPEVGLAILLIGFLNQARPCHAQSFVIIARKDRRCVFRPAHLDFRASG